MRWPFWEYKAANVALEKTISYKDREISNLNMKIAELKGNLAEARRRTVPMEGAGMDVNFLPLSIIKMEMSRDIKQMSDSGDRTLFCVGKIAATMMVSGDIVIIPNHQPKG